MSAALLLCLTVSAPTIIVDVRVEVGDGRVLEHATVVVDGGRIRSVGSAPVAGDGETIDGRGKVLTPGLIEPLSQIGLTEISQVESTRDDSAEIGPLRPAFRAADGFNPSSALVPVNRAHGVTSAVSGPRGGIIAGSATWVDLTGSLDDRPDPARPVAMVGSVAESAHDAGNGARGGIWLQLRQLFGDTRFYAKKRAAFARGDSMPLLLSPLHLEAMLPVIERRLPLLLEANRASDILAAVELGRSEGIDIVILGGAEAWRVASELAATRTPVILRPSAQTPVAFEALAARDDAPALLAAAGVTLMISSGWTHNLRRLRQEAGLAVAYGMPRAAALRAITQAPAQVFGRGRELGTVTAGKRADLVLWSGDPLELQTRAEMVWIRGHAMSLNTRQRQLAERYRPRE